MHRTASLPKGRPNPLDRETIVVAACAVADREGASAITMRRLGAELGVDPTAFYRYFRNKQELLDAMAEHLFAQLQTELRLGDDPRANVREMLLQGFRLYRAHPGLAVALARQRDDTSALSHLAELTIRELRRLGLSERDAARAYHTFIDVVVGTGVFYALAPEYVDPKERAALRRSFAALPPETHPDSVAVSPHLFPDVEEVFGFTVELLLDAFERRAAEASASTKEEAG
jgi:AcrR family transcriptional regulator